MRWVDATCYGRSDEHRVPRAWRADLGVLRIAVHHSDCWHLSCSELNLDRVRLLAHDATSAQCEALDYVRSTVRKMLLAVGSDPGTVYDSALHYRQERDTAVARAEQAELDMAEARKKSAEVSSFAASVIGKACAEHVAQAQNESFAEFKQRHDALGCHWCEHDKLVQADERAAHQWRLLTEDPSTWPKEGQEVVLQHVLGERHVAARTGNRFSNGKLSSGMRFFSAWLPLPESGAPAVVHEQVVSSRLVQSQEGDRLAAACVNDSGGSGAAQVSTDGRCEKRVIFGGRCGECPTCRAQDSATPEPAGSSHDPPPAEASKSRGAGLLPRAMIDVAAAKVAAVAAEIEPRHLFGGERARDSAALAGVPAEAFAAASEFFGEQRADWDTGAPDAPIARRDVWALTEHFVTRSELAAVLRAATSMAPRPWWKAFQRAAVVAEDPPKLFVPDPPHGERK